MQAYGSAYRLGRYDVKFDILEGNVENAFDIIKRAENGVFVGEYYFPICILTFNLSNPIAVFYSFFHIDTYILHVY